MDLSHRIELLGTNKNLTKRSAVKVKALSRPMANTRVSRPSKRGLLMSSTHSQYCKTLGNVSKCGAPKFACVDLTILISGILTMGIAMPILVRERKQIHEKSAVLEIYAYS